MAADMLNDRVLQFFGLPEIPLLQEFYQVAFRKKICGSLDELPAELDKWLLE